jgi:Mrp family chromosome partitioning ATPase
MKRSFHSVVPRTSSSVHSSRLEEVGVVVCCWSAKGGQGTSVVACALALVSARAGSTGAVLVDLAGDAPAVMGLPDDSSRGVADWLREGALVPSDGLARLEVAVAPGLSLLPRGHGPLLVERAHALAALLVADSRSVVIDAGVVHDEGAGAVLAARAAESLLVTRPCFLAVRRAVTAPVRASGVILVAEEGRALTANDIESVLGVPVRAQVQVTAQIARAVDAGVLATRLPRSLERELRNAA